MATEAAGTSQPAGRPEAYPVPAKVEEWKSIPSFLPQPPSIIRALADFHRKDLNVAPTLALCVPIFLLFLIGFEALGEYLLESSSSFLTIFFVGSYIVFSSYFVANHYMTKMSSSYGAIPEDKKFYVLSNLIKSAVLLAYTPTAAVTLYNACVRDEWSTPRIRTLGVLYAIPDAVSMLLVTRMAMSTKVHHICVIIFMVVNLYVSYEQENIGRALVVYAIFSTFAYLVNLLLASRFLPVSHSVSLTLSALALAIYVACLGFNWTWQVWYLYKIANAGPSALHWCCIGVYLAMISMVVRDDVVLCEWLYKNVGKRAAEFSAEWEKRKNNPSSPKPSTPKSSAPKSDDKKAM